MRPIEDQTSPLPKSGPTTTATPNRNVQLAVCAGFSRDWTAEDSAARTTSYCTVVPAAADGQGVAEVDLTVDDPTAVYIAGSVWPVGYCGQQSFDTDNKYVLVVCVNEVGVGCGAFPDSNSPWA